MSSEQLELPLTKTCITCKKELNAEGFREGRNRCRGCERKLSLEYYYNADKEHINSVRRERYAKNRETQTSRDYRNTEERREWQRQYDLFRKYGVRPDV